MAASDGAQGAIGRYVCRRCHLSFSACARQCGDPHVLFDAVGDAWRCAHCGVRWQVAVVASQHAKLSRALMRAIMEAHAADASAAPGRPPVAPRGTVAVPSAVPRDSALATLASSASSAASQWSESSDAAARAVDELQREHAAHSARGRSASEEAADALAHGRSDAKEYGSVVATGLGMAVWGASRAVAASASGLSAASAALLRGAGSVTSASVGALGRALRWRKGDAANAAGSDSGQPDEAAEHS